MYPLKANLICYKCCYSVYSINCVVYIKLFKVLFHDELGYFFFDLHLSQHETHFVMELMLFICSVPECAIQAALLYSRSMAVPLILPVVLA